MAKVSIITPAFNAAPWLPDALGSVLAQSHEDWEWIVIDDGSTDGSAELMDSWSDPRITVLRQPNRGVSAARNAGLSRASGDFVTFLDADDMLPPDSLSIRVAALAAAPEAGLVHSAVSFRDPQMDHETRRTEPFEGIRALFPMLADLNESAFTGPFYMLRRELIGAVQFREGLTHCEDILFFLDVSHAGALCKGIPEITYWYRGGTGGAMSNLAGLEHGYLTLLREARRPLGLTASQMTAMQRKIGRVLWRSWLRSGRPDRSISALARIRAAGGTK